MNLRLLKALILFIKVTVVTIYFPAIWLIIIINASSILDFFIPVRNNYIPVLFILIIYTFMYIYNTMEKKW